MTTGAAFEAEGQILAFLDTTAGLVNLECPLNGMARLTAARTYEVWDIIVSMITDPSSWQAPPG